MEIERELLRERTLLAVVGTKTEVLLRERSLLGQWGNIEKDPAGAGTTAVVGNIEKVPA